MTQRTQIHLALAAAAAFTGIADAAPADWYFTSAQGSAGAQHFTIGTDSSVAYEGISSGFIRSNTTEKGHSGSLAQAASADGFEGKTVHFKAYLRSRDVAGIAGLWFRADDANGGVVAFRNYQSFKPTQVNSPVFIDGTTDWKPVELTIDVPSSAVVVYYGIQLIGTGKAWIDSVSFDISDTIRKSTVLPTPVIYNAVPDRSRLEAPSNLDFELAPVNKP